MSAIQTWQERVAAHHRQSLQAQGRLEPSGDFWSWSAPSFRDDPRRTGDHVVNRLLETLAPHHTVLDVGGGGGRLALPLALHAAHVAVVEPSPSMVAVLRQGAEDSQIDNVTVVESDWETAEVPPADIVLCANVLYGVEDIAPFVDKLTAHARIEVLVLMFMESPQSHLSQFWERVHQEGRVTLPAIPHLLEVCWEIGVFPNLDMLSVAEQSRFVDRDAARQELMRRLYVTPATEQATRLETAIDDLLTMEEDTRLAVQGAAPRRMGLLSWPGKAVAHSGA